MTNWLKRFWQQEDGVALAFGITFFLLVFLLGMSVYAVGETVRQRMELQNAADAAAYSGAVVQADTLSRVACINQAMSWTYVMMNRRIMDYITDKWLEKVDQKWEEDLRGVREFWNWQSTCGTRNEGTDYWVGFSGAHKQIFLNHSQMVSIDTIRSERRSAASRGGNYQALAPKIDQDRDTLRAMRQAEQRLLSDLPNRIEQTVRAAIRDNIAETPNDQAAGGADLAHVLIQHDPSSYTETMKNREDQEKIFLAFGDFKPDLKEISRRGVDRWWVRTGSGEGFQRQYRQSDPLRADWQWFGIKWVQTPDACVPVPKGVGFSAVQAMEVQDGYFDCRQPAEPYRLKEEFFGENGTILVGVKRKLNNPFAFIFADGVAQGLFRAFTVPDSRSMWTAAAARAGYAPPGGKSGEGAYEVTFLNVAAQDTWNLCEPDWDAVLLPVALAFDDGKNHQFRNSGKSPLAELYGKLSPGSLGAPPGMNDGGTFDLQRSREVLHH